MSCAGVRLLQFACSGDKSFVNEDAAASRFDMENLVTCGFRIAYLREAENRVRG